MKEEKIETQKNDENNNNENKQKSENNSIKEIKEKKVKTRVILVFISIIITVLFAYISYRGDYLETMEIGANFKQVFFKNLKYQYAVIGINFIILFIVISIANMNIKKGLKVFFEEEKKTMPKLPNKSIAFILSIIISVILANLMKEQVALFINKAWFGTSDPVFGFDLRFYIFEQPLFQMLIVYFIGIVIGVLIYSTIYYIVIFNIHFDGINARYIKKEQIL